MVISVLKQFCKNSIKPARVTSWTIFPYCSMLRKFYIKVAVLNKRPRGLNDLIATSQSHKSEMPRKRPRTGFRHLHVTVKSTLYTLSTFPAIFRQPFSKYKVRNPRNDLTMNLNTLTSKLIPSILYWIVTPEGHTLSILLYDPTFVRYKVVEN